MLRQPLARVKALGRPATSSSTLCPRCTHAHEHALRLHQQQSRTFLRSRQPPSRREALDTINVQRLARRHAEWHNTRQQMLAGGAAAGVVSIVYVCYKLYGALQVDKDKEQQSRSTTTQLDAALPAGDPLGDLGRKVVRHDEDGHEVVPTGNSTVPEFPRTIEVPNFGASGARQQAAPADEIPSVTAPTLIVPASTMADTEYTLVGLGTRSVSFLGINVYVVGYYIATADIAELQARLVRRVNPIASTLISNEKDELRAKLLDPVEGEAIWDELLRSGVPARSCVRVVPVRDTDFPHLRDGFVRAIQPRVDGAKDEKFGEAMREFKRIFNRGKVPKQKELLMLRERDGQLTMVYDDGKSAGRQVLGTVDDERISRALWMNYLGGKKVASEEVRKNIVNGVMEFVERPIGTVAAQVV